jgi:hypothetical protein
MLGRYHALREYESLLTNRRYTLIWEYIHMGDHKPGRALFNSILQTAYAMNLLPADAKTDDRKYQLLTSPSRSGCPYWAVSTVVLSLLERGWRPWLDAHWANMTKVLTLATKIDVMALSWSQYEALLPVQINRRIAEYWFNVHQAYAEHKREHAN